MAGAELVVLTLRCVRPAGMWTVRVRSRHYFNKCRSTLSSALTVRLPLHSLLPAPLLPPPGGAGLTKASSYGISRPFSFRDPCRRPTGVCQAGPGCWQEIAACLFGPNWPRSWVSPVPGTGRPEGVPAPGTHGRTGCVPWRSAEEAAAAGCAVTLSSCLPSPVAEGRGLRARGGGSPPLALGQCQRSVALPSELGPGRRSQA